MKKKNIGKSLLHSNYHENVIDNFVDPYECFCKGFVQINSFWWINFNFPPKLSLWLFVVKDDGFMEI